MAKRVAFSGQHNSLEGVTKHYRDVEDGLRFLFSPSSPRYLARFISYRPADVAKELETRLDEADKQSTMTILAALEAAFRVNYLQRCY